MIDKNTIKKNLQTLGIYAKKLYKPVLTVSFLILLIIIVFLLSTLVSKVKLENSSTDELTEQLERTSLQLIDDTSEIRKTLSLPLLQYEQKLYAENQKFENTDLENEAQEQNLNDVLLNATQDVINTHIQNKLYIAFTKLLEQNNVPSLFKKYNLEYKQKGTQLIIKKNGSIVAYLDGIIKNTNNKNTITSFTYNSSVLDVAKSTPSKNIITFSQNDIEKFLQVLNSTVIENLNAAKKLRNNIFTIINSNTIQTSIKEANAKWKYTEYNNTYIWKFYSVLNELLVRITVNPIFNTLNIQQDVNYNFNIKKSTALVEKVLSKTNFNSQANRQLEKKLALVSKKLQALSQNQNLLSQNIGIKQETHEDEDYVYFDIVNTTNNNIRIGAFAVQKNNAALWITDKDLVLLNSFNIPTDERSIKNDSINILLIGSHNGLADTILLVNLNPQTSKIKMISIPRDLYFGGKKINWYFKRYSPKNFTHLVSTMLAVPITQYVSVDMYAFVKIVNIIGGIPVYLEKDLIDPSYKIKENGIWSTLYYPKGEYNLSGIEALRIARSRNTSNDFDRALRQQLIITGFQEKLLSMNAINSALSLIKIIKEIKPFISTNIALQNMAELALQYKSAPIEKMVLSTKNILYYSFSNLYNQNLLREEVPEDFDLGAYILIPKNNNWEEVQNYIRDFIVK